MNIEIQFNDKEIKPWDKMEHMKRMLYQKMRGYVNMKNIFFIFIFIFFSSCSYYGGEKIVKNQLELKRKIILEYSSDKEIPETIAYEMTQYFILEFQKGFPDIEIIQNPRALKPEEKRGLLTVCIFYRFDSFNREVDSKIIRTYFIEADAVFYGTNWSRSEVNHFHYSIGIVFLEDGSFTMSRGAGAADELITNTLSAIFDKVKPINENFQELKNDIITKTKKLIEIIQKADNSSIAAIPVISINPNGGTFTSAQTVTISATNSPTSIQYSFDNYSFPNYTSPITISSTATIYAKATNSAGTGTAQATFTISSGGSAPVVSISPNGGTFTSAQTVTISATNSPTSTPLFLPGRFFQYSFNNSTWTNYTAAITISSTTTLYAKATNSTGTGTAQATFTINSGFTCRQWYATNASHQSAGRATYALFTGYKTVGGGDTLGSLSTTYNYVKETSAGYFKKGTCN